ncbi:MAG: TylF/MycF/NovP-related O-methyltransferase [Ferrovibrio sp.]
MIDLRDDWEFNVLGIYNYRKTGPFDVLFDFVRQNHKLIEGDIVEAGVYRGSSLIGLAMLLKELGSDKKVYGYDSFAGFPPIYDANDGLEKFEELHAQGRISRAHVEAVRRNMRWRQQLSGIPVNSSNVSSSGDFSGTSLAMVKKKIEIADLDNIVLVDGMFSETMVPTAPQPAKVMAVLMDCDLYQSYLDTFAFVWPRLSKNGMIYLDEYYSLKFPGAKIATDEFLQANGGELTMAPQKPGDFERWYITK